MALERIVTVTPAFDRRDPDPRKNYGIHGCTLRFVLKGAKGATQFVVYTNWQLPHVDDERCAGIWTGSKLRWSFLPLGADVGYHSPTPQYEGHTALPCDILDSGQCYYDGSSLAAEDLLKRMIAEGDAAIWSELEAVYHQRFGEEDTNA